MNSIIALLPVWRKHIVRADETTNVPQFAAGATPGTPRNRPRSHSDPKETMTPDNASETLPDRLERLSPAGEHCFFGYYDLPAWDAEGQRHLAHRVGFMDRMPTPADVADIGYLEGGDFHKLGETKAWNFQQGAMLQWLPAAGDPCLIHNERVGYDYGAVVRDPAGTVLRRLPRPVANVDPLARFALSINFARMTDYRPGYGYAGPPDPFAPEAQPEDDGIFRLDLESGATTPILSLRRLGEICRPWFGDRKILVNHLNLNPSGTRFVALVRHFPDHPGDPINSVALSANADGTGPRVLWHGVASHYHWRDDTTLAMVIKDPEGRITLAEFTDGSGDYRLVDPDFFTDDGHESYSPDRKTLLYDSYPINGRRHLYLYDLKKEQGRDLGGVRSRNLDDPVALETRCDLHPRWHPTGHAISLDSVHEGFRGIYALALTESEARCSIPP